MAEFFPVQCGCGTICEVDLTSIDAVPVCPYSLIFPVTVTTTPLSFSRSSFGPGMTSEYVTAMHGACADCGPQSPRPTLFLPQCLDSTQPTLSVTRAVSPTWFFASAAEYSDTLAASADPTTNKKKIKQI